MYRERRIRLEEEMNLRRQNWIGRNNEFTITWKELSIFVKVPSNGRNQPFKRLIDNISGIVKPGTLVVLMGPSGAGKSTLMEALAQRNSGDVFVEGDIRVNGKPATGDFRRVTGFLHQEDLFVETLTVREHLEFMVRMKMNLRSEDVKQVVSEILIETNLTKCADTKIGKSWGKTSISGGERKRLAFATETLTNPVILFCDEPTTGLDSFSAMSMMSLMKEMTLKGKTVLCTVHQPSSELFEMFNELILMTEGRIAFIGNKAEALNFFNKHGYSCPDNCNPAEVIIEALSELSTKDGRNRVRKLCNQFAISQKALEIEEEIMVIVNTEIQDDVKQHISCLIAPSALTKFYWLTKRSFLQVLRDPSVQAIRIIQKLGIALMASLCFNGNVQLTQKGIQSVQGAIFILITENTFPPMYGILPVFADEYPLLLRERKSSIYSIHLYYISKLVSLLPGLVIEPIMFLLVAYFIVGLKTSAHAFFMTCLIVVLTANVAAACGSFFMNAFGSVSVVMALLVPLDYSLMVTSGIFVKLSSLPVYIAWFRYLSWFMYSNEALSVIQWENVANITCEYEVSDVPCLRTGEEVLKKFNYSPDHLYENMALMSALYVVFHALAYILLWWRTRKHL